MLPPAPVPAPEVAASFALDPDKSFMRHFRRPAVPIGRRLIAHCAVRQPGC
jgi:hypothetical protein